MHESGRDLGHVGEVVEVNREFLQMFLDGGYVPVISPIGLADDGSGLSINADDVAAAVAVALGAPKLIYLTDVPGILESAPDGELVRQLTAADLARRIDAGAITGGMKWKAWSILAALAGRRRARARARRPPAAHRHRRALHRPRGRLAGHRRMSAADRRRDAVARIIRARRIGTQEELLAALDAAGFRATQATLSRDLARLGARRVPRPEGGTVYELGRRQPRDGGLGALRGLVSRIAPTARWW